MWKNILKHPIFIAVLTIVLTATLEGKIKMPEIINYIYQNGFVKIWYVWFGIAVGIVYWFIKTYVKMIKFQSGQYETFHRWLDKTCIEERDYKYMSDNSLEGRIVAMLQWWKEREGALNKK